MTNKIYLDHAATTPVDEEVLTEMLPYFTDKFGNAMSVHSFGQEAQEGIDQARSRAAKFFGCSLSEIIFTSGATESNNLAIKGSLRSFRMANPNSSKKPHIITTAFEHHCVLDACTFAEKEGLCEVTYLPVGNAGIVRVTDVLAAIRPETILVSVMYVNNEIGTVQPIGEIGTELEKINAERSAQKLGKIVFHTDATQAINYFACDVNNLKVDMLSMSAHKIYGPKGVGLLYVRRGTPIRRIQDGGDQEAKLRAGTHNVPGIVGLGKALEMVKKNGEAEKSHVQKLRDLLIDRVLSEIPDSYLNGSGPLRSPNNANFRFDNVEGEGLLLSLDLEGIACSTGSACSSGALDPSHVLLALGLRHEQAHGSLRVTLGKHTTPEEISAFMEKLKETVTRLRKISGNVLADFS
ncbi:MAG TPA: cysteine desulfurase family protein [Candidatus Moranbacteria bacterium]|nr:cysteine desulfurase family protein [Candidatus Moranbacteria bacterium]